MAARSKGRRGARKLALDILFEHEVAGTAIEQILDRYARNPGFQFAERIVRGVQEHREELDAVISSSAERWEIERMPAIDRNLLRIGLFELTHSEDVPAAVAIDEAVELAKIYSGQQAARFVNGILGKVADSRKRG